MDNKNNHFLNSELSIEEKNKDKAKFHIVPVPLEKTVSYGKGTSKGPQAIIRASNELERYTGKSLPCIHGIHTHPFLNCNKPIKVIMNDIENITEKISKQNKKMRRFSDVRGIFNTAVKLKLAKDLKDVFRVLDKDHTGTLDIQELKAGLEKMRIKMDDVELKQLWVALDLDGDDKISYDDFERFCQKKSLASQVAIVAKGRSTDDGE